MYTFVILYFSNILLLGMLVYVLLVKNYTLSNFIIFVIVLYFALIIGMRDLIGLDTITYIQYFETYCGIETIFNSYFSWKGDYFFFFLGWLIKQFTNSPRIYILILDFLSIYILIVAFLKISRRLFIHPSYFIIFLIFLISTSSFILLYGNVIRQGLAFSLVMLSLSFMLESRWYKGIFILLLAFFTHKSSIIFFFIYIIVFLLKIKIKYLWLCLLIFFIFGKIGFVSILSFFHIPFISEKIIAYTGSQGHMVLIKNLFYLLNIILFSLFINKNKIFDILLKIYILVFAFNLLFVDFSKISSRILLNGALLSPFLYYIIISLFFKNKRAFFLITGLMISHLYAILVYSNSSISSALPYYYLIFN